jgi:hypothetical protein
MPLAVHNCVVTVQQFSYYSPVIGIALSTSKEASLKRNTLMPRRHVDLESAHAHRRMRNELQPRSFARLACTQYQKTCAYVIANHATLHRIM